jgi:hypothetical protein
MKKEKEDKSVYLSAELYERVKERAEATDFGSIEEYITFVLQEVLKEEEPEEIAVDREQEKEVKKRLRALGYLD